MVRILLLLFLVLFFLFLILVLLFAVGRRFLSEPLARFEVPLVADDHRKRHSPNAEAPGQGRAIECRDIPGRPTGREHPLFGWLDGGRVRRYIMRIAGLPVAGSRNPNTERLPQTTASNRGFVAVPHWTPHFLQKTTLPAP